MVLLFAYRNACDELLPLLYSFEECSCTVRKQATENKR